MMKSLISLSLLIAYPFSLTACGALILPEGNDPPPNEEITYELGGDSNKLYCSMFS